MDPAVHTGERMPTRSDIARWTEITVTPAATGDTWDKVAQCKQVAIKTVASWPGEEHESWVRHATGATAARPASRERHPNP